MMEYFCKMFDSIRRYVTKTTKEMSFEIPSFYTPEYVEGLYNHDEERGNEVPIEHITLGVTSGNTGDAERRYTIWRNNLWKKGYFHGMEELDKKRYLGILEKLGRRVRLCSISDDIPFYTKEDIDELFQVHVLDIEQDRRYYENEDNEEIYIYKAMTDEELKKELESAKRITDGVRGMVISFVHKNQDYIDRYGKMRDAKGENVLIALTVKLDYLRKSIIYRETALVYELNRRHPIDMGKLCDKLIEKAKQSDTEQLLKDLYDAGIPRTSVMTFIEKYFRSHDGGSISLNEIRRHFKLI